MIEQLPFVLSISSAQQSVLDSLKPWRGEHWTHKAFVPIKSVIRAQLDHNQHCCAYCGLPFKGPKDRQIEHIAPKAKFRQPQFTFVLKNLVLSCGYCNDLIVKGSKATVVVPEATNYEDCEFLLVHPYFDDPDIHYDWVEDDENDQVLIQINDNSEKAKFSIKMFDLASTGMSELRSCGAFRRRRHIKMPLNNSDEESVQKTMDFKPGTN